MDGQSSDLRAPASGSKLNGVDIDIDGTESVVSDLSTDEFAKDPETDFRDAMNHQITQRFISLHTLPDSPGGVSVLGVGNITMPLEEAQAQLITLVDEELSVDEYDATTFFPLYTYCFDLDKSMWPNIIQGCLDQATSNLGIATPLIANPWSLILMRSGHTYGEQELVSTAHDDIGTLVIFLPSRHEGGEVVVKHGDTEKVVFAPNEAAQSFTTEDYNINSLPIKSGYIWALLCSVDVDLSLELRPLRHTLRRWIAQDCGSRSQDVIYYPLKGEYTMDIISTSRLISQDSCRVDGLRSLSDKIPFEIFFAFFDKIDDYDRAHGMDQSKKFKAYIFSLDGYQITNPSMMIDTEAISSDTDLPYTAVAVIPRDKVLSFFYGSGSVDVVESLFASYAQACLGNRSLGSVIIFKEICSWMMTPTAENTEGHWAGLVVVPRDLLNILEAFLAVKSYSWFSRFGLHYASNLPESTFSRFCTWLAIAYLRDEKMRKAIEAVLSGMILAYPRPAQQIKAVKAIIGIERRRSQNRRPRPRLCGIPGYILPFVRQVLKACIEACGTKQLTAQDGQALVGFSLYFDDPFAMLSLIKDKIGLERQPAAILGLIHKVDYYGKLGYLPQEESRQFSLDVAKSLITSTAFVQWRGTTDGYYFKKDEVSDMSYIDYDDYDEYSGVDDWLYGDDIERRTDKWEDYDYDKRMQTLQRAIHQDYLRDEYDDQEYHYADSYRTCLYIDNNPLRKPVKYHPDENRYEDLYGITRSLTFSPPGIEEKGVHYRSFYCLFEQLVRPMEQPDEVLELLASTIVDVAPQIPHTEFDTLWIPMAKEFIPAVNNLREFIGTSRESLLSGFLSAILKAYVNTWVGQYPRRPSLVRPGVHCSCPDCKGLNVFLADPSLRAGRFKADKARVQHVLDEMTRANVDFEPDMVEDVDSMTLVVTKPERLFALARRQWGHRRYHASKQIAKFGLEGLEFIFGTEWTSFLSMAHLGGVGFDNLEIRTLLKMETGLSKDFIKARSATMFFRGLPPPPTTDGQVNRLARKRKWSEADLSSDIFSNDSHDEYD